jgi:3-dehydroquinate synthase
MDGRRKTLRTKRCVYGARASHIREGALSELGQPLTNLDRRGSIAIVSNPTVWGLYGERTVESVGKAGFKATPCIMPDGEEHKTLATVANLYEDFLDAGLDRSGIVVALGGGVVGDVAGFAAATFMRGVSLVQIPTTLLSMIDSSVGGKTGVDLPHGKNLVGAFHQPGLVVVDPQTLSTLPASQVACGLGETLKHAIIGDPTLFNLLEIGPPWDWIDLITRSVAIKIAIVEEDPFEKGQRAVLNLGHTAGHALEFLTDYRLPHGEAVSIGLVVAAHLSALLGKCAAHLPDQISAALAKLGLPVVWAGDFRSADILVAMAHDKKRRQGRLRWILPLDIGEVAIFDDVPEETILAALAATRR